MSGLLHQQIVSMRASAHAVVATADAILAAMGETAPAIAPGTPCDHPMSQRTPAPRMGAPDAWRCACGQEGE